MTATTWDELFERAAAFDATEGEVSSALRARREGERSEPSKERAGAGRHARREGEDRTGADDGDDAGAPGTETPPEASPTRVVADADVLAADLLVGGDARRALDRIREHSWMTLVASDPLLDDAEAVVRDAADATLAADWRARVAELRDPVDHRRGDHPALASAKAGGAMHVLSLDDRLLAPGTAATVRSRVETSLKHPKAFASLFDAESLYREATEGEGEGEDGGDEYPGPDRDPRA